MIYYELSDFYAEKIGVNQLEQKLKSFSYIKFYAFVCHNRTLNIKPHYHCLIQVDLNNKKAKNRIEKDFKDFNAFVKSVRNAKGFARYLQHLDYVDKEKYNDDEVITSSKEYFDNLKHIEVKISKIEMLLRDFYNYIVTTGAILSQSQAFYWFMERGQANYFISHKQSIITLMSDLSCSDDFYRDLERKCNVTNDNTIDNINYTIDNLF